MLSDDARRRRLSELAHGLGSMSPPELHDATRRALLTIYSPQQAAIWLNAHAAGDAHAVARKALRLCGVDPDRPAPAAATRQGVRVDPEPPDATAPDGSPHLDVQAIVIAAIRALFACEQADEVHAVLLQTVARLGGRVVRAADAPEQALPLDLSLGVGGALLPMPDPQVADATDHLHAHLPHLVEDAHRALDRLAQVRQLAGAAVHAGHPSLLDRRAYERLTGRITPGEVLILIRLEGLHEVDDTDGPALRDQAMRDRAMRDQVMSIFGAVLREHMRIRELAVRLGDGEFLLVIEGPDASAATPLLERLRIAWERRRPAPVRMASGVAAVSGHLDEALEAADRRLYGRADEDTAASVLPGARAWA